MSEGKIERSPKIIERIVLHGAIRTTSPLLIGNGIDDNLTDILLAKNENGVPFIPGTSFAGALRRLNKDYENFFGKLDETQSIITTSDIELWENAENNSKIENGSVIRKPAKIVVRDGVAIDYDRGVGKDGAKYDYEAVERGAIGKFRLVATIREWQKSEVETIENAMKEIGEMILKGIFLGAHTGWGLGKVVGIKDTVKIAILDFSKKDAVKAWLLNDSDDTDKCGENEEVLSVEDVSLNPHNLTVEMNCKLTNSILVRDTDIEAIRKAKIKTGNDDEVKAVQMCSRDEFVIPGSTVKGVIRNHAYHILKSLGQDTKNLDDLMGYSLPDGSMQKGRFIAEEVYFRKGIKSAKQTRNRIDRFTGSTIHGALFTNGPVWQDEDVPSIKLRFVIKECKDWEAGLLLFVLKDIWTGCVAFGGEKSVGRGTLSGVSATINFKGKYYKITSDNGLEVSGSKDDLEIYAQKFAEAEGNGEKDA